MAIADGQSAYAIREYRMTPGFSIGNRRLILIDSYRKIYAMLSPRERKRFLLLMLMILVMGLLEAVGVASILPFLSVVSNPGVIETNRFLAAGYNYGNFQDTQSYLRALGTFTFAIIVIGLTFKMLTLYVVIRFGHMRKYTLGLRLLKLYVVIELPPEEERLAHGQLDRHPEHGVETADNLEEGRVHQTAGSAAPEVEVSQEADLFGVQHIAAGDEAEAAVLELIAAELLIYSKLKSRSTIFVQTGEFSSKARLFFSEFTNLVSASLRSVISLPTD